MSINKFFFGVVAACLFLTMQVSAQHTKHGLTWYTDVEQVYKVSQKTDKPVFAFFTGSDWCGWCHKLERAVFEKKNFQAWAKENVVLLELDFPRKTQQPEELQQQNQGLASFFKVKGFPTIWLFEIDMDTVENRFNIDPYGSLGYPGGAPKGKEEEIFLNNVKGVLSKKKES